MSGREYADVLSYSRYATELKRQLEASERNKYEIQIAPNDGPLVRVAILHATKWYCPCDYNSNGPRKQPKDMHADGWDVEDAYLALHIALLETDVDHIKHHLKSQKEAPKKDRSQRKILMKREDLLDEIEQQRYQLLEAKVQAQRQTAIAGGKTGAKAGALDATCKLWSKFKSRLR
ncbi:hypothetical protein DFH11DRAFT_1585736 [Phellopilus nigrolimitatus]|nr:hypothetical protein DFH11DRAFT_1585736 [Phellopilus nigrolimitatus]